VHLDFEAACPRSKNNIKEGGVTEIRELKSVRGGISVTPKLASFHSNKLNVTI